MRLAYGNYGMPHTPVAEMVQTVAEIGYDALELCVTPGYPTAPPALSAAARHTLRADLAAAGLAIGAMMMTKVAVLTNDPQQHEANLDYLREVLTLRSDLGAEVEIATTLGGKVDDWPGECARLAACVADWADVAQEHGATFAIEPHVGGLIHSPDRARWLLEELQHPALRVYFDYSHFELIDVPLEEAVAQLSPWIAGVHVKDVAGRYPHFRFLLPGEGELDYAHYLTVLGQAGYDDDITIEVSGQVFNAADYEAVSAARFSYQTMAAAFARAGVVRGARK